MEENHSESEREEDFHVPEIPRGIKNRLIIMTSFTDGYVVRQQFEYFRNILTFAPMNFHPNGLTIKRGNGQMTALTCTSFQRKRLLEFYLDETLVNSPETGSHIVNINLTEFYNQIKCLAKKEGVRFSMWSDTPGILVCQPFGSNKSNEGSIKMKTEPFEELSYEIDDGIPPDAEPNVKVPLGAFCNSCNGFDRARYSHGIFRCYPEGVHLYGSNETVSVEATNTWGKTTVEINKGSLVINKKADYFTTKVPISVIKALKKMSGWNTNGVMSIYCRKNGIVKLETPVSCFGENVTYLMDPEVLDK